MPIIKEIIFFFPTLLYPLGNISCVFSTLACHQMSSVFCWGGVWGDLSSSNRDAFYDSTFISTE